MGTTFFVNFVKTFGTLAAGSAFTYFQSLGALGQGILGASVLPVTLAVGATAGSGYLLH